MSKTYGMHVCMFKGRHPGQSMCTFMKAGHLTAHEVQSHVLRLSCVYCNCTARTDSQLLTPAPEAKTCWMDDTRTLLREDAV